MSYKSNPKIMEAKCLLATNGKVAYDAIMKEMDK